MQSTLSTPPRTDFGRVFRLSKFHQQEETNTRIHEFFAVVHSRIDAEAIVLEEASIKTPCDHVAQTWYTTTTTTIDVIALGGGGGGNIIEWPPTTDWGNPCSNFCNLFPPAERLNKALNCTIIYACIQHFTATPFPRHTASSCNFRNESVSSLFLFFGAKNFTTQLVTFLKT